jgi:AraC-like DNA-binding protein
MSTTLTLHAKALRLISLRACDGLTIEELLAALEVSRSTLERQFILHVGHTPRLELVRVRLARAKELLATTNLPPKAIAKMAGYRNVSNFGAFFRKQTGLSPLGFRRLCNIPSVATDSQDGSSILSAERSKPAEWRQKEASTTKNEPFSVGPTHFSESYLDLR